MVESLLGLLNLKSNDSGWHGSCLSLAELARRGLLLPKRLDVVVDNVLKALVYDERRGLLSNYIFCQAHTGPENLKNSRQKTLLKSNKPKIVYFFIKLHFGSFKLFPVQKLIFGQF